MKKICQKISKLWMVSNVENKRQSLISQECTTGREKKLRKNQVCRMLRGPANIHKSEEGRTTQKGKPAYIMYISLLQYLRRCTVQGWRIR